MSAPPILADLERQAAASDGAGLPVTARLLRLLAEERPGRGPLAERLRGRAGSKDDARPTRLAGALHAPVLPGKAPPGWLSREGDGRTPSAVLAPRLWPRGPRLDLGRAGLRGRWAAWTGGA